MPVVSCPSCLAKFESAGHRNAACPTCGARIFPGVPDDEDDRPRRRPARRRDDDEDDRPARRPRRRARSDSGDTDKIIKVLVGLFIGGAILTVVIFGMGILFFGWFASWSHDRVKEHADRGQQMVREHAEEGRRMQEEQRREHERNNPPGVAPGGPDEGPGFAPGGPGIAPGGPGMGPPGAPGLPPGPGFGPGGPPAPPGAPDGPGFPPDERRGPPGGPLPGGPPGFGPGKPPAQPGGPPGGPPGLPPGVGPGGPGFPGAPGPVAPGGPGMAPGFPQLPGATDATVKLSNLRRVKGFGIDNELEVEYEYTAGTLNAIRDVLYVKSANGAGEVRLIGVTKSKGTIRIKAFGRGKFDGEIEVVMERKTAINERGTAISNTLTLKK